MIVLYLACQLIDEEQSSPGYEIMSCAVNHVKLNAKYGTKFPCCLFLSFIFKLNFFWLDCMDLSFIFYFPSNFHTHFSHFNMLKIL